MSRRIERPYDWSGSGMMNQPERLEELEARKAEHARKIRGKPEKSFGDCLDEKRRALHPEEEEEEDKEPTKGAKDPHLGLSPGQPTDLAAGKKGRRAGQVIVKG